MARRYLALWFPFLPTDRLRRRASRDGGQDERPLVVAERRQNAMRLTACDRRAGELGLAPGLTLADARARIPDLTAVEADPAADARLLDEIAAFCERFTPLVALDGPAGLALDITGCAHLFGGETGLRDLARQRLRRAGLATRAAIAGTPDAARALARFSGDAVVPTGEEERFVRALPTAALGIETDTVIALSRAGLKSIGDLVERPPALLAARFGADLPTRLARVLGREDARITPLRPPPACMAERHLAEPVTDAAGIEAIVVRLIAEIAVHLERRGEGGRVFCASFFRTDGAVRSLSVETGRPSRDAGAILRLWRERVETLADPLDPGFGFDAIRVAVPVCEPLGERQPVLGGQLVEPVVTGAPRDDGLDDDAVADLVDRLVVRFGRERVLRFAANDTHNPDRAARRVPASGGADAAMPWPEPEPGEPPTRPLHLFEPPQPIETLAEVPDGPPLRFRWRRVLHEIARAEGPERIAPEWWREASEEPTRDYYRVEDAQGRRFWLFRAGLYGRETEVPRWFLHGLFA